MVVLISRLINRLVKTKNILFIDDLIVNEDCRNCGIGKLLIQNAINYAIAKDCETVELTSYITNEQVEDLESRVLELESSNSSLEAKVNELESSNASLKAIVDEIEVADVEDNNSSTSDTQSQEDSSTNLDQLILDSKIDTNNPHMLLEVAKSKIATEEQLVLVADKSLTIISYNAYNDKQNQINIAKALSENPKATANVMISLLNSKHSEVIEIANSWIEINN